MKTQNSHNLLFNNCGDLISIEAFISCPESLSIEEQKALKVLDELLKDLVSKTNNGLRQAA